MPERRYILFHKPYGVLSQFTSSSPSPCATLRAFIPIGGIYPVGRLDLDSEGLLLLTGDGALQHRLSDPKFEHPKTYWAQVEGTPDDAALMRLAGGVTIGQWVTRPALAALLDPQPDVPPRDPPIRYRKSIPTAWIEMTITEGRNRQVRRMTAAVGLPTLRLIRMSIGTLKIGGLKPGQWRDLTPAERTMLKGPHDGRPAIAASQPGPR